MQRTMTKKISEWNGYPVHGDVKELDRIIESDHFFNLDQDDIINVLSAEGNNYVTFAINANLGDAFNAAINSLPCKLDKVNSLLFDFFCGNKKPEMSELSCIPATLSEANTNIDVKWGISSDETLGDSYKVVLVASVKA